MRDLLAEGLCWTVVMLLMVVIFTIGVIVLAITAPRPARFELQRVGSPD